MTFAQVPAPPGPDSRVSQPNSAHHVRVPVHRVTNWRFELPTTGSVGELSGGTAQSDGVHDVSATADGPEPSLTTGQLLLPVTIPQCSWLAVLADLGPGLVKAAVELPEGAIDLLAMTGRER